MLEASTKAVQAPHDQRVPRPQIVDARLKLGTVLQRAGPHITKHPLAPGRHKRIDLKIKVLLICRHAGVTDEVAGPELSAHRVMLSEVSDTGRMRR
jgi:hypothetical protein